LREINSDFEIVERHESRSTLERLGLSFKTILFHFGLFAITFVSIAFTSLQFFFSIEESVLFTSLLLLFLATHEFGHYFAAVYHRVSATLPYFIPLPLISPIGTMGAVIKLKERIQTTKKLFDIGISGPLAGFVVSFTLLVIGFATLPSPDYVLTFEGHNELKAYVQTYGEYPDAPIATEDGAVLMVGNTLLYSFMTLFFKNVPPMWEMYHFPFLFAGWLGLFFTGLNLMPIGQLDGGHILYSLIGFKNHQRFARVFFGFLSILGAIGTVPLLVELLEDSQPGWGIYAWAIWGIVVFLMLQRAYHKDLNWTVYTAVPSLIISFVLVNVYGASQWNGLSSWAIWMGFILFFVKIEHPPVIYQQNLDPVRKSLGWFGMFLFVVCISPSPLYLMSF
jgi:membrane-associated protease RseP (regulator of RpoE activity)